MAINVMLPTQQIHQTDNNNAFANHQRAVAYQGNESIPFQVNPADNLKYAEQAIGAIDKWQEQVRKDKEDALVTKASNTYLEAITQRKNEYTNLQGENAVNGFEQYTKDLDNIQKQFSKTFKNTEMQGELNKQMERNSIGARLDGKNWHDKQVYTMQEKELLAQADLLGQQFITGLDSPVSKINEDSLNVALQKYLNFKGTPEGSAQRIEETQKFYYNAFKSSLLSEIKHNPNIAKRKLDRVRNLIGEVNYRNLMADAIEKAEDKALANARLAAANAQRKYYETERNLKEADRLLAPLRPSQIREEEKKIREQVEADPKFKDKTEAEKNTFVDQVLAQRVASYNKGTKKYNDEKLTVDTGLRAYIQVARDKGYYDPNVPESIFPPEAQAQYTNFVEYYGGQEQLRERIKHEDDNLTISPTNITQYEVFTNRSYEDQKAILRANPDLGEMENLNYWCIKNKVKFNEHHKQSIVKNFQVAEVKASQGAESGGKLFSNMYNTYMTKEFGVSSQQLDNPDNLDKQTKSKFATQGTIRYMKEHNIPITKENFGLGISLYKKSGEYDQMESDLKQLKKNIEDAVESMLDSLKVLNEEELRVVAELEAYNHYDLNQEIMPSTDIIQRTIEKNNKYTSQTSKFLGAGQTPEDIHKKTPSFLKFSLGTTSSWEETISKY